jgi:hypothetical protein
MYPAVGPNEWSYRDGARPRLLADQPSAERLLEHLIEEATRSVQRGEVGLVCEESRCEPGYRRANTEVPVTFHCVRGVVVECRRAWEKCHEERKSDGSCSSYVGRHYCSGLLNTNTGRGAAERAGAGPLFGGDGCILRRVPQHADARRADASWKGTRWWAGDAH